MVVRSSMRSTCLASPGGYLTRYVYLFDYYRFYYHLEKRTNDGCWIARSLAGIRLNMYRVEKYMMFCFAFFAFTIIYLTIQ